MDLLRELLFLIKLVPSTHLANDIDEADNLTFANITTKCSAQRWLSQTIINFIYLWMFGVRVSFHIIGVTFPGKLTVAGCMEFKRTRNLMNTSWMEHPTDIGAQQKLIVEHVYTRRANCICEDDSIKNKIN